MTEPPTSEDDQPEPPFRERLIGCLKEILQKYAANTQGFGFDPRSRWAYAFNPQRDGDPEKPVYASMAALRAPNFVALRVGETEGNQVVIEVEHEKLVTQYITDDVENSGEFPKIRRGLRGIILDFERMADIRRYGLLGLIESAPEFRRFVDERGADPRVRVPGNATAETPRDPSRPPIQLPRPFPFPP